MKYRWPPSLTRSDWTCSAARTAGAVGRRGGRAGRRSNHVGVSSRGGLLCWFNAHPGCTPPCKPAAPSPPSPPSHLAVCVPSHDLGPDEHQRLPQVGGRGLQQLQHVGEDADCAGGEGGQGRLGLGVARGRRAAVGHVVPATCMSCLPRLAPLPDSARSTAHAPMSRKRPSSTSARSRCTWLSSTCRGGERGITSQSQMRDKTRQEGGWSRAGRRQSPHWQIHTQWKMRTRGQRAALSSRQEALKRPPLARACSTIGSCSGGRLSGPPCSNHSSKAVSCSLQQRTQRGEGGGTARGQVEQD